MIAKLRKKIFPKNPRLGTQVGECRKALQAGRLVRSSELNSSRLRNPELVAQLREKFDVDEEQTSLNPEFDCPHGYSEVEARNVAEGYRQRGIRARAAGCGDCGGWWVWRDQRGSTS